MDIDFFTSCFGCLLWYNGNNFAICLLTILSGDIFAVTIVSSRSGDQVVDVLPRMVLRDLCSASVAWTFHIFRPLTTVLVWCFDVFASGAGMHFCSRRPFVSIAWLSRGVTRCVASSSFISMRLLVDDSLWSLLICIVSVCCLRHNVCRSYSWMFSSVTAIREHSISKAMHGDR